MEGIKEELLQKGLVEIDCKSFLNDDLLSVATRFGRVVPGARNELVQPLPARDKGNGPEGSFSYTVGYGAFPWHTDTAYWDIPAHYLLLASEGKSSCATLYQDLDVIRQAIPDFDYLLSRAVFLLNVKGKKRYLSPLFEVGGQKGFRMDFHIYQPSNKEAEFLTELVGKVLKEEFKRFEWTGHNAVVIDNWRMIHAREDAQEDKTRLLKRIYINELD